MFTFKIADEIVAAFPAITVQAVAITGLQKALHGFDAAPLLDKATQQATANFGTPENMVATAPVADWREGYRAMGVKPSSFKSSIEALSRRALAGKPLATGIALVDLYNAFSLEHAACLGGYDLQALGDEASMQMRLCQPESDSFTPLGGAPEDFPLTPKLVVYAMGSEVCCWGFNCRDAKRTGLHETTDSALFFAESITPDQTARATNALTALAALLTAQGATASPLFKADQSVPGFVLEEATAS